VRLTLDALRPGELRGLVNGRLVAIDRPDAPVTGAGGLRLEGRTRIRLALPQYVSTAPVYADRFEKNPAYVNDPFMRHWAAPEGQWITMRDGLTWLRGDILGRVKIRLPVVTPSVLHLAIPEGETDGQCTVALRDSRLCVFTPASRTNAAISVAVTNIPEEKIETAGTLRLYTVNLEDDLLWLSTDSAILGRTHLPPLARGRRARIEGFTTELLHQTLVRRENVFDTLFNESLFNWTINGGVWEVINRFQCEPTWSHMNGESTNSFAGLWSKFVMSGDFCVEFYAGMRMGWYERPGDFDLTVHSRRNATCDGYSITTAGWDPDHSQIYTRLFRNGELEAVSTAYTAPRVRDGSVRAGYEPLIAAGRPVHGAWYGMRFRRVGDQLSYVFDNEPILSWRDPAPLDAGTFGIWTYRNSMMVARVRIAAESVRPRPFRHWVVAAPPPAPPPEIAAAVPGVRVNGRPAELLDPAVWQDADEVSRPLVRFGSGRGKRPVLCVTALEGGGTFLVAPHLAPIPAGRLLGWHFEIARHPEARVNFEFTAGRLGEHELTLTPESSTRYSFVLSGSDDARGDRRIAGSLPQPPAPSRVADLAPDTADRALVWTPVDVWLPAEAARKGLMVHVDGFGNLQPGDIQQGLGGNPPGAWYAVRNFHEIYSGVPELEGPAAVRAEIDALTRKAADLPSGCLNELRLPAALDAREPVIAWAVRPDAAFNLAARLDAATPEALRVASTLPWPSPLLPARGARLDGQPAPGWQEGNDYLVLLPRDAAAAPPAATTLTLELADGRTFKQLVPLASAATSQPPVLLACEMPEGGIQTFESRTVDPQQYQVRAGFALCCTDAVQGACIRFQNAGVPESRLDGRLLMNYDPVATPLLQFRYRADPMAHVTLNAGRCTMLFSERTGTPAAPGATGILDQAWHTWLGSPLTTAGGGPLRGGFAVSPGELRIGSRGSPDQTGHYSAISLDDIACGPAVGPRHPLAFRLSYTSRHGLAEVQYALGTGTPPWSERSAAERDALKWCAATNLEVIAPDTAALPEGTHHLFTRARSTRGAWSAVYDIPFVLDRQPPQIAFQVRAVPDRYNGTCLDVSIQGGYAPPLTRNLRLLFDGKPLNLQADNGTFSCGAASMQLEIDWPWLLRKSLARYKDGDTLTLTLDGVADAAGNESAAVQIPIRLVFADDKQPPAVLPVQNPTNLLVHAAQFHALQDFFSTYQGVTMQEAQQENGCSFVPFRLSGTESAYLMRQFSEKMWDPEAFPWLAFSVRIDGEFAAGTSPFEVRLRPGATLSDQAVKPKNGTSYVWKAPTADNQPFTLGHMDWKPGQWVDFLVNVRDLLRDETKMNKACTLRDVALYFPAKAKYTLQVRGLSILAPWSAPDVLRFRAYDLNGANGLTWQGGGASARLGLRPARLTLPADDNRWLKVRVADRPGNLSKVFLYPMPPNAAPVPESFPAEVEVEDF
jgi:hypothetical protein